jgi:hypothetical protein
LPIIFCAIEQIVCGHGYFYVIAVFSKAIHQAFQLVVTSTEVENKVAVGCGDSSIILMSKRIAGEYGKCRITYLRTGEVRGAIKPERVDEGVCNRFKRRIGILDGTP